MRKLTLLLLAALGAFAAMASPPADDTTARKAPVPLLTYGSLVVKLTLDRDYMVIGNDRTKEKDIAAYMLNPEDGQSALVIAIGEDTHTKTDSDVAEMHEGAKVTPVVGVINGSTMVWRRYRDSHHLYSDCSVRIKVAGSRKGKDVKVDIGLIANSEARLKALEDCLARIEISEKK